jgi:hypothetical protein
MNFLMKTSLYPNNLQCRLRMVSPEKAHDRFDHPCDDVRRFYHFRGTTTRPMVLVGIKLQQSVVADQRAVIINADLNIIPYFGNKLIIAGQ